MANNPQSSGSQPFRPPVAGSMGLQNFGSPFPMQTQQGQTFIPAGSASQQFLPIGQVNASQPPQYSHAMQLAPQRPAQPLNVAVPSQAITMAYTQSSMPLTSSSQLPHQTGPPPSNLMSNLGGPGVALSSSYTFAQPAFGPQHYATPQSQVQPSQMHASVVPVVGQPWLSAGGQGGPVSTPVQQVGQQSSDVAATAGNVPGATQQSSSDWQEHTAQDGRRYYYNKKTRQSSWEKPLELMTPLEMSSQVRGI